MKYVRLKQVAQWTAMSMKQLNERWENDNWPLGCRSVKNMTNRRFVEIPDGMKIIRPSPAKLALRADGSSD